MAAEPTAEAGTLPAGCTDAPVALIGTRSPEAAAAAASPPHAPRSPGLAARSSQSPHAAHNGAAGASSGPSSPPPTAFAAMMAASRNAGVGAPSPKSPHRWWSSNGVQPDIVASLYAFMQDDVSTLGRCGIVGCSAAGRLPGRGMLLQCSYTTTPCTLKGDRATSSAKFPHVCIHSCDHFVTCWVCVVTQMCCCTGTTQSFRICTWMSSASSSRTSSQRRSTTGSSLPVTQVGCFVGLLQGRHL
jgi:hypothetical protein